MQSLHPRARLQLSWVHCRLFSAPAVASACSASPHLGLSYLYSSFKAPCRAALCPRPWRAGAPSCLPAPAQSLGLYAFLLPRLPASPCSELLDAEGGHVLFLLEPPGPGAAGNSSLDVGMTVLIDGLTEATCPPKRIKGRRDLSPWT